MAYPIHDWRDSSKYPRNPLAAAPAAFIEKRRKHGYPDEAISSVYWHWEFLRRLPLFQKHWDNESVKYFSMFGVCGTFRPHPKTNCPEDLLFRYELFHKNPQYLMKLDGQKSFVENTRKLKLLYDFPKASKPAFELFMISGYVPWPKLAEKRKRRLSEEKYAELLRVLDALADGETLTQIARELRPALPENALYKTGARLRKSALDLQEAFTGLPRIRVTGSAN
jgi:hypothetical protein